MAVKDYENAVSSFTKAITLQPAYAEAYNNRAYTKLCITDYSGAIADCDTALALMKSKPSPFTYNNLARAYSELNQFDTAFKYFNKAIELNNTFAEAYFERGRAKQKNNDPEGACKDWSEAKKLGYTDSTNMTDKYCKAVYYK